MLLSQIRQAAGMTQEELAASLGIKQPTLGLGSSRKTKSKSARSSGWSAP